MTKEELAELRRKAYEAFDAHEADMKNDPEYRKAVAKVRKPYKAAK